MRRVGGTLALAAWIVGCGPWQKTDTEGRPLPGRVAPRTFDAPSVYRAMGFFVAGPPLPFVASLRVLADATPDSTLTLFALSLANTALTFRRDGNEFVAQYHVEVTFRTDSGAVVRQVANDQVVRVRSFQETLRSDESVIFQQFVGMAPGVYLVGVAVRDRHSLSVSRVERLDTVPWIAGHVVTAPIPVFEGTGRNRLEEVPRLLVNPRATLPFGGDSLRFYVEAYGVPSGSGAALAARVLDPAGAALWRDTVALVGGEGGGLAHAILVAAPTELPLGQAQLEVTVVGTGARAATPFLVSFSDRWAAANFEEMLSLLRYFERSDLVAKLRGALPEERLALWREFFRASDPDSTTPENEALDEYFRRVQAANLRFQESGEPGWLTDRGEVFITLGEPDEALDLGNSFGRDGVRGAIRWTYNSLRVTLYFQDQTGFGRFRLTPLSRAEYQRALARVRVSR